MTASIPPPSHSSIAALIERLAVLGDELRELAEALPQVNDPDLQQRARALVESGKRLVAVHGEQPRPDVADALAGLLAATRGLHVPSRDPELGATPSLRLLRAPLGLIVMAASDAIDAARACGRSPTAPDLSQDLSVEVPRAGIDDLLRGIARRLDEVGQKVDELDSARGEATSFVQQTGLLNLFVPAMRVEIDLAKLHLSVGGLTVDFGALARAVEAMTELSGDLVATVRGWLGQVSEVASRGAEAVAGGVRRVRVAVRAATRVIRWRRQSAAPTSPADRAGWLNNLGSALRTRYAASGEKADLDRAIDLYQQAMEATAPGSPDRASLLNNLAAALHTRYVADGKRADLDRGIDLAQQALEATAPGSPDRAALLNNLGNALRTRYAAGGEKPDLDRAIDLAQQALEATTPGGTDRAALLSNLGAALHTRYAASGEKADLDRADALSAPRLPDVSPQPDQPPPDFDLGAAREMIIRGEAPPEHWRKFINILDFSRSRLRRLEPLAALTYLQRLDLRGTQVSDVAPLAALTNLQSLNLWDTQVSDVAPLAALTNLQTLDLRGTQVSDVRPLANLIHLRHIDLWGTRVGSVAPLAALVDLQTLDLTGTPVSDVAPLTDLTNLQNLDLRGTRVSDLAPLTDLTSLQTLDLRGTSVSDVAPLADLTNLQILYLNGTPVSDVAPLDILVQRHGLKIVGFAPSITPPAGAEPKSRSLFTRRRPRPK